MAGRPRKFDERDILMKAAMLFWKKGYEGTSSEELLEAMGIGKGSFYLHFKDGKREVFIKSLTLLADESLRSFEKELQNADDKIELIKEHFYRRLELNGEQRNYGCFMGNTLVELTNTDDRFQYWASDYLKKRENQYRKVIEEAQQAERIISKEDPAIIAKLLTNLWNGMNISKRMQGDEILLKKAIDLNLKILD